MKSSHRLCLIHLWVFMSLLHTCTHGQGSSGNLDGFHSGTIYYLNSDTQCKGDIVYDLHGYTASVRGFDISNPHDGPKECILTLTSTSQFQGTILEVKVTQAKLNCGTALTIKDGTVTGNTLYGFDCRSPDTLGSRRFKTSGNTVTFHFTKEVRETISYQIDIDVSPKRASQGYENNYGKDNVFPDFDKFEQEAIVGIIGGAYLLTVIICSVVVIISYRNYRGKNKEWETRQLASMKTDTKFTTSEPSNVWSMPMSQDAKPVRRTGNTYPVKRNQAQDDGDSDVYNAGDTFQKRRLMKEERSQRMASNNTSFMDTEDMDEDENFREKIIIPRSRGKNKKPPAYEEAVSEEETEESESEDEESSEEESSDQSSTRKRSLSSEEETETESEEETESESDDESRRRGARSKLGKTDKRRPRKRRESSVDESDAASSRPSSRNPRKAAGRGGPAPAQTMPYGMYPPQGQFVPMIPAPQFQPMPMVQPMQQPPQYEANPPPPQVRPTDPPVYSYLVRRGYQPVEPSLQGSSVASSRSAAARPDDSETRLESGVEYMRR